MNNLLSSWNMSDVIDSRDIIDTINELEADQEGGDLLPEFKDQLSTLQSLQEEAETSPDWKYGEVLIRHTYFTEYCQELLEDVGEIPKNLPWYIEVDWERTANNLKQDYFTVDFDGVDYLIRV